MRVLASLLILFVVTAIPCMSRDYTDLSNEEIRAAASSELHSLAAELLPSCGERVETIDAIVQMSSLRNGILEELGRVRLLTTMEGIWTADAIDDSLVNSVVELFRAYADTHPDPIINPGTEQFERQISQLGFVNLWASGFLVNLELQQTLHVLAEFYQNRSDAEVEAAQDAFLRHFTLLSELFRAQHVKHKDMHSCNLANLEWAIGRLESENGAHDFVERNRKFAFRGNGTFAYRLTLVSSSTGEQLTVDYPLPHLQAMDEGP